MLDLTPSSPPARQAAAEHVPTAPKARLGWLDALRGVAAMTVMVSHYLQFMLPGTETAISRWFIPGTFGVLLFFMISGFIVPASLERRGSVRTFWISRLFRIYPMCVFAVALGLAFKELHWQTGALEAITPWLTLHPSTTILANSVMMQDMLGGASLVPVMWTLSYEMVFYCLIAALFSFNLHRCSGPIATGFAVASLITLAAAPPLLFSKTFHGTQLATLATVVVAVVGIYCMVSRKIHPAVGGLLIGGLALLLVVGNGRLAPWYSMAILATMFSGTALYRAEQKQAGKRATMIMCGFVALVTLFVGTFTGGDRGDPTTSAVDWNWLITIAAVWGIFTLGVALRHRRIPGFFTWLGRISYSVYMLHVVILSALLWFMSRHHIIATKLPLIDRLLWLVIPLGLVLGLSQLTYKLVELPFQGFGKRAIKFADRRWSTTPPPAPAPVPVAAEAG